MSQKISQQQKIDSLKKQAKKIAKAIKEIEEIEKNNLVLSNCIETLKNEFDSILLKKENLPNLSNKFDEKLNPILFSYELTVNEENSFKIDKNIDKYNLLFTEVFNSTCKKLMTNENDIKYLHVSLKFTKPILIQFVKNKFYNPSFIEIEVLPNINCFTNEQEEVNAMYEKLKLEENILVPNGKNNKKLKI